MTTTNSVPTTPAEIRAAVAAATRAEQETFAPETLPPPPLFEWRGVGRFLDHEPPPRRWVFDDLLPAGIVGAIFATGGTGKSFLALHLGAALAACYGFGPFMPTKPTRVLVLAGEDGDDILHERVRAVARSMGLTSGNGSPAEDRLRQNFEVVSLVGTDRVLIALGENGNPATTPAYEQLREVLRLHRPEVVIIDPLSRFYGLNENDNAHATAWVACLEALARDFACTVLFLHHEAKGTVREGDVRASTGRGASALRDGVRWALSMAEMDPKDAKEFGPDVVPSEHVALYTTKGNYNAKWRGVEYLRRGKDGTLSPARLHSERRQAQVNMLGNALREGEPLSRRKLTKSEGDAEKALIEAYRTRFQSFNAKEELPIIIERAITDGLVVEVDAPAGKTTGKVLCLAGRAKAITTPTADDIDQTPALPFDGTPGKLTPGIAGKNTVPGVKPSSPAEVTPGNQNAGKTPFPASPFPALDPDQQRVSDEKTNAGKALPLKGGVERSRRSPSPSGVGVAAPTPGKPGRKR